jgi:hypothetical protein
MELVTMAKETKKMEFAWDTEKKIGEFGDNKKRTEVRICTLDAKTYVSATTYIASQSPKAVDGWKRTKNNTMEMSIFKDLQEFVSKWEMMNAFGSETEAKAPAKPNTLKAKQQAQGARAKAAEQKKEALKLKDLSADEQKELKSALKSNGMKVADVIIIKDGNRLAIEVKATGQIVVIK